MPTYATAQDAYASAHAEACALLDQLWEHLNDLPAPNDDTHWGHVGNVQSLVADLKRALNEEDAE